VLRDRRGRQDGQVLIVHATKKLLDRIGLPTVRDDEQSITLLGHWCATALAWRPQVALLVNEPTLLPVLMPLAPAATLLARVPEQIAVVLAAHATPKTVIEQELRRMRDYRLAKTANRSVVGIMNEFTQLANAYRHPVPRPDLTDLALRLATTPCSPLYGSNISPDRELTAFLRANTPRPRNFRRHRRVKADLRHERMPGSPAGTGVPAGELTAYRPGKVSA
jgi:hypothetical protein